MRIPKDIPAHEWELALRREPIVRKFISIAKKRGAHLEGRTQRLRAERLPTSIAPTASSERAGTVGERRRRQASCASLLRRRDGP